MLADCAAKRIDMFEERQSCKHVAIIVVVTINRMQINSLCVASHSFRSTSAGSSVNLSTIASSKLSATHDSLAAFRVFVSDDCDAETTPVFLPADVVG